MSYKADCLNKLSPHIMSPTCTYPRDRTKMVCEKCAHTRPATPEEIERVKRESYWTIEEL